MIIVNLKGGLWNQMFQYALGRKLALKNDDTLKLCVAGLDRANEVGDIYRPFSLGRFNVVRDIASETETRALKYPYGILSKVWQYFSFKVLRRTHTGFEPAMLQRRGDIFLDGYWQSPNYFADIRDTLLQDFTLAEPLTGYAKETATQMQTTTSVSIHIRRGDYVKNPHVQQEFGICSQQYYQTAIAEVTERHPDATFFVFSDDIDWVKTSLNLGERAVYVSDPELTDTTELYLMSQCKHNIIANSTFSWWAAWLNQHPDKLVIAPTPWFDRSWYDPSLIPDSWLQLPK